MLPSNLGADKIHINDQSERSDNYKANNHLEAAYAAFNIPLGKFNIYAGARLELFRTAVTTYGNVSDKSALTTIRTCFRRSTPLTTSTANRRCASLTV
ncbi:MAG: hypothetical protein ACLR8Y_05055 [Alistipes indistinctus]